MVKFTVTYRLGSLHASKLAVTAQIIPISNVMYTFETSTISYLPGRDHLFTDFFG